MVRQVECSIPAGKVVVKCWWAWLAKGLVKGQDALSAVATVGAALLLQSAVKVVRGFGGFVACEYYPNPFSRR